MLRTLTKVSRRMQPRCIKWGWNELNRIEAIKLDRIWLLKSMNIKLFWMSDLTLQTRLCTWPEICSLATVRSTQTVWCGLKHVCKNTWQSSLFPCANFVQYWRTRHIKHPFCSLLGRIWQWRLIAGYVTVSLSFTAFSFSPSQCLCLFVFSSSSVPCSFSLRLAALEFFLCSCCGIVAPHSRYLVSQSWLPFPLLIGSKQHGCLGTLRGVGTYFYPRKKKNTTHTRTQKNPKQNNNTWLKMMPLTLHTVHNDKRCSDILVTGQSNAHS